MALTLHHTSAVHQRSAAYDHHLFQHSYAVWCQLSTESVPTGALMRCRLRAQVAAEHPKVWSPAIPFRSCPTLRLIVTVWDNHEYQKRNQVVEVSSVLRHSRKRALKEFGPQTSTCGAKRHFLTSLRSSSSSILP